MTERARSTARSAHSNGTAGGTPARRAGSGALRLAVAVTLTVAGAGLIGWLSPGGLGHPGPIEITRGTSATGYRFMVDAMAGTPGWWHRVVEVSTDAALLILLGLLVGLAWIGHVRDRRLLAGAVLTLVATAGAYALSEGLKLVVDQERPCRAMTGVESITRCPDVGDWSFPSNHATIAGALAVGLAVVVPRLALFTLPLAGATALLRVVAGVHYPHDVLAGLTLGGVLAVATVAVALHPTARLLYALRLAPAPAPTET
ncbi:undecaprenyl-diphosphatase [Micromonospora pisi]|uniref:Undecaprenyl-diphosphatase n=1 Tax=Micromonospora pisi TaxID=589240 RepID=A0A495JQC2_9ACTN|nr:phosphatase PAP2 family protein [Micromonospora pisi]RKR90582.1 undecaprenyl-diphosphatase [Micromonospora pisi]